MENQENPELVGHEMMPEVSPIRLGGLYQLFMRYLDVRAAWKVVARVREELRAVLQAIEETREYNNKLAAEVEALKEERDALTTSLSYYSVVDPNAKCPACGATDGEIRTIQSFEDQHAYVEHTCHVCRAVWPEQPVYTDFARLFEKVPMKRNPGS